MENIHFRNDETKFLKFTLRDTKKGDFSKYSYLFEDERLYGPPTQFFSKGWFYAFMENGEISYFTAIAFDKRESYFFNEIRYKGKIYRPGFRLTSSEFKNGGLEINEDDLKVSIKPSGKFPDSKITIEIKGKKGALLIDWDIKAKTLKNGKRLNPWFSIARFLRHHVGEPESYVASSPIECTVKFQKEGEIEGLDFPEEIMEKEFSSRSAYRENVYLHLPFYHCGWKWHFLSAFENFEKSPDYFFGLMHVFHLPFPKAIEIPVHQHMYLIDGENGDTTFFDIGELLHKKRKDKKSSFDIYSKDGSLRVHIDPPGLFREYKIKGIKFANLLSGADIKYVAYACTGELEFNGKKYKALGTSELVGEESGYWL